MNPSLPGGAAAAARLAAAAAADGEFRLAARYWDGTLTLAAEGVELAFVVRGGVLAPAGAADGSGPHIGLAAPAETWRKILAPVPSPLFNDVVPAQAVGLVRSGDEEAFWQYYPAVRRLVDILRTQVAEDAALR